MRLHCTINNSKAVWFMAFSVSILFISCGKPGSKQEQTTLVADKEKQSAIFKDLASLVMPGLHQSKFEDSMAFLLLPVHATCPSCLHKTIDSIVKHKDDLKDRHYIIISANGGYKKINSYFRERGTELPVIKGKLFLDSTNAAFKYNLYDKKPTIYYTCNELVYKKVAAIPATITEDLREFFSGFRDVKSNK